MYHLFGILHDFFIYFFIFFIFHLDFPLTLSVFWFGLFSPKKTQFCPGVSSIRTANTHFIFFVCLFFPFADNQYKETFLFWSMQQHSERAFMLSCPVFQKCDMTAHYYCYYVINMNSQVWKNIKVAVLICMLNMCRTD